MKNTTISTIDITGKEWFDKVNGNSYFSARVVIDYGTETEKTLYIPYEYGYGESYLQAASKLLFETGILKSAEKVWSFTQWCRENNIPLRYTKIENCKKAEIRDFGSDPNPPINREFLKTWAPEDFKKVKRAISKHLRSAKYNVKEGGKTRVFLPANYNTINMVLGVAYTSSGDYAGMWICNVELQLNETHNFIGFAINELGQVIGIAQDKDEKETLVRL